MPQMRAGSSACAVPRLSAEEGALLLQALAVRSRVRHACSTHRRPAHMFHTMMTTSGRVCVDVESSRCVAMHAAGCCTLSSGLCVRVCV